MKYEDIVDHLLIMEDRGRSKKEVAVVGSAANLIIKQKKRIEQLEEIIWNFAMCADEARKALEGKDD